MRITAIRRQRKRQDRLNIHIDGEFRLAAAEEVVLRAGLRRGSELSEEALRALEADDQAWKAREAALHLLAHRDRGEGELRQRLLVRGYPEAAIAEAIDRLRAAGLLDDERFAHAYARDRLRARPTGRIRLVSDLRARGIPADLAESAADDALDAGGENEHDLIQRALRRFRVRRSEDPIKRRRRAYAFLARRGFSGEAISEALSGESFRDRTL